jgi:hypothetical protein
MHARSMGMMYGMNMWIRKCEMIWRTKHEQKMKECIAMMMAIGKNI